MDDLFLPQADFHQILVGLKGTQIHDVKGLTKPFKLWHAWMVVQASKEHVF
jgi:hypothetical protein